jgi:hypothetical protein
MRLQRHRDVCEAYPGPSRSTSYTPSRRTASRRHRRRRRRSEKLGVHLVIHDQGLDHSAHTRQVAGGVGGLGGGGRYADRPLHPSNLLYRAFCVLGRRAGFRAAWWSLSMCGGCSQHHLRRHAHRSLVLGGRRRWDPSSRESSLRQCFAVVVQALLSAQTHRWDPWETSARWGQGLVPYVPDAVALVIGEAASGTHGSCSDEVRKETLLWCRLGAVGRSNEEGGLTQPWNRQMVCLLLVERQARC